MSLNSLRRNDLTAGLCFLALGLTGCAGPASKAPDAPPPPPAAAEPAPEHVQEPAPAPAPAPPPEFSLRPFIGALPQRVETRFGPPGLVRREGEAEVWQYVEGPCVLLFFIYDNPKAGRRVAHAEARTSPGPWGPAPPVDQACLKAFGSTL